MNGSISNNYPGAEKSTDSPIKDSIQTLEHSQGVTESRLEELETRLGALLRSQPPSVDRASTVAEVGQSDMHEHLLGAGRRQASYNIRLQDIINRLTV